jgi:two-component system, LytTR family, sensor kinase
LRFTCDLSEEVLDAKVAALMMLPLIENAVRHGIAQRSQPGEIRITASRQDGMLLLSVCNDAPASQRQLVEGIGLAGTRSRLQQHYGTAASFSYERLPGGLMKVRMTLPFAAHKKIPFYAESRSHRG